MRIHALLVLLCCTVLWGCGPTTVNSLVKEQGASKLSGHEILALVQGNTLFLHSFNEDVRLYFAPSGKMYGRDLSTDRDSGRWDVTEGGELCLRLDKWWYGDQHCFTLYHVGDKDRVRLANTSGVLQYTAEQEPGDSKDLARSEEQGKKSLRRSIREEKSAAASPAPRLDEGKQQPALVEESRAVAHDSKDTGATVAFMAQDCPGCNLAGVDLGKAELVGAKLAGVDLHGANLSMANLRRADLQKANLRDAVLTYANLPGADLRGADLRGAKLKGANLIKADLTGAKLDGADLTEVLKDGAKGLK